MLLSIIIPDADLEHGPDDINEVVAPILSGEARVVGGIVSFAVQTSSIQN